MKRKREPPVTLLYLVTTKPIHLSSHHEATALDKVLLEGGKGRRMEWKELVALTLWKSSKKNDIDTQSNEQQFKATCLILQIGKNKGRACKRKLDLNKIDQRTLPAEKIWALPEGQVSQRHQGRGHFQVLLVFSNCPTYTNEYRHWLYGPLGFNYIIRIEAVFSERSHPPFHYNYQCNYGLQLRKVFLSLPTSVIS